MKVKKKFISLALTIALLQSPIFYGVSSATKILAQEEYVNVPDYNLKRGFLEALRSLEKNHTPVTDSDIRSAKFTKKDLEKIVNLSPEVCVAHCATEEGVKIHDLTGIEYCINLESLSLVNQRVTDISPVKNLTKLKKLDLRNNAEKGKVIEDISALKKLVNLEQLDLSQAKIKNVDFLKNLKKLKKLNLMSNKLTDISFLKEFVNLTYLDLSYNRINDITPLNNLVNLEILKLSCNPTAIGGETFEKIKDISSLKNLRNLSEFSISNHDIKDISVVKNFKNLSFLEINNNKIDDFSVIFNLPNLSKAWVMGNKENLTNENKDFKEAKEIFNSLNKSSLTKSDISNIDSLLNAKPSVKAFFSNDRIKSLENLKNDLKVKESIENKVFDDIKLELIKGEILKVKNPKAKQIIEGFDISKIKNKLPKTVDVIIKKEKEEVSERTYGIIKKDERDRDILSFLLIDENNKIIKDEVSFTYEKEGKKTIKSKDGYLDITIDMMQTMQYFNTNFSINSTKYKLINPYKNFAFSLAKTTPTKMRMLNDKAYYDQTDREFEKLLVVKLQKVSENETVNPNESENPKVKKDENIGVKDKKLILKIIDENGALVTEPTLTAKDTEGVSGIVTAKKENNYYIFNISEDYEYNLIFNSQNYDLVSKIDGFSTSYLNGVTHIKLNGINTKIKDIENKENRDEYFTIKVKSKNNVTPLPKPTPNVPKKTAEGEFIKNNKGESLKLCIIDENKNTVLENLTFSYAGNEIKSHSGYATFSSTGKNEENVITLKSNNYKLKYDFKITSSNRFNELSKIYVYDEESKKYVSLPLVGLKNNPVLKPILVLVVEKNKNGSEYNNNENNPNSNENNQNPQDKLGIKGNTIFFKLVDEKDKAITDVKLQSYCADVDLTKNFENKDGLFSVKNNAEEGEFTLKLISNKYALKEKVSYETKSKYANGSMQSYFSKITNGNEVLTLTQGMDTKNLNEKYFVVKLNTLKPLSTVISKDLSSTNTLKNSNIVLENLFFLKSAIQNTDVENETTTEKVRVNWDLSTLKNTKGTYKIKGDLIFDENIKNPKNLTATLKIVVKEKKQKEDKNEFLGNIIKENGKTIFKIALIDKNKELVTDSIVVSNGEKNFISKDGYVEVEALEGKNTIKIVDENYKGIDDKYKNDDFISYQLFDKTLISLNNKSIKDISELGIGRHLRLIVAKKDKINDDTGSDNPNNPSNPSNPNNPNEKLNVIFTKEKDANIKSDALKEILNENLILKILNKNEFLKDLEFFKDKDVDIFDIFVENTKTNKIIKLPNGNYEVTLTKKKDKEVINVYNIKENKELIKHIFTQDDKTVTFETTHLSLYAIEYKTKVNDNDDSNDYSNNNSNDNNTQLPKTNINSYTSYLILMLVFSTIVLFIRKKIINNK